MSAEEFEAAFSLVYEGECECDEEWIDDTFPTCAYCQAVNAVYADHVRLAAELTALRAPVLAAEVAEAVAEASEALNDAVLAAEDIGRGIYVGAAIRNHQKQMAIITHSLESQADRIATQMLRDRISTLEAESIEKDRLLKQLTSEIPWVIGNLTTQLGRCLKQVAEGVSPTVELLNAARRAVVELDRYAEQKREIVRAMKPSVREATHDAE